ncbi:MAG: DUF2997 domain-containing protein [Polyangiaceae bacterium]|nr:DUF2997 domain-containing protein [Polyangiaceae bacterium]
MKEQRIVIDINPEGRISADADGFTGDMCIKDLEKLLDGLAPGERTTTRKPDKTPAKTAAKANLGQGKKP